MKITINSLVIFSACLLINLSAFNWNKFPIYYFDSSSYMKFAESIIQGHIPDISFRTPIYPLYLLSFGTVYWLATIFQTVIGAVTSVYLYKLTLLITKNFKLSMLITILASLNYQVISYQSVILTETLTTFLLILFIYYSCKLDSSENLSDVKLWTIFSILLTFTKPTFLALPLISISIMFLKKTKRKQFLQKLIKAILLWITVVIIYSSANLLQNGFFGISYVSDINLFGKFFNYGYIEKVNKDSSPQFEVPIKYYKLNKSSGWYKTIEDIYIYYSDNKTFVKQLKLFNKFLLKSNFNNFFSKNINMFLSLFTENYWLPINSNTWVSKILPVFEFLNKFNLVVIIGFLVKSLKNLKNNSQGFIILLLPILVLYTYLTVAFFSPTDYVRLLMPTFLIINLMSLLLIHQILKKIYQTFFDSKYSASSFISHKL